MSPKKIRHLARRKARQYRIDPKLVEQALWDAITLRDEQMNRYPI